MQAAEVRKIRPTRWALRVRYWRTRLAGVLSRLRGQWSQDRIEYLYASAISAAIRAQRSGAREVWIPLKRREWYWPRLYRDPTYQGDAEIAAKRLWRDGYWVDCREGWMFRVYLVITWGRWDR